MRSTMLDLDEGEKNRVVTGALSVGQLQTTLCRCVW